ncbi:MAG: proline--tRNA ligase [Desulfobacteraceae bacterium]|jgi:prolyl-tRNA synthetase|nr:MAG: proline--tRNA ligase [Desulfobacteraceae bacterium]
MRYSKYFIPTQKEVPSDAEVVSHQLMLRAGMIRKLTSGIYTYLPLGLRSLKKVERIIREEMDMAGAIELVMPAVQPAELWQESGRWDYYGKELLRLKDRHGRDACFGPTHEEVITDLVRREVKSYKQLPVNFYQIQTKFRDEIRPRFGLMRGREFIMKDAYSFDAGEEGVARSYMRMHEAYCRIFERCGLAFRAVEADTGTIGGSFSHEFMVLADTGEDEVVSCTSCAYAANLEKAEVKDQVAPSGTRELLPLKEVATPGAKTVEEVTSFLSIGPEKLVKTIILEADGTPVAVLVRGDHEINLAKLKVFLGAQVVEMASTKIIEDVTGAPTGFAGPKGIRVKVVADNSVRNMSNYVTGGNKKDLHLANVTHGRDYAISAFGDLRIITSLDMCPRCGASIEFRRGIEVGHIFKLGTKYSKAMKAFFLDERGEERPFVMGCYGIGVGRTLAAAIEQNHDEKGITFPLPLAPFQVALLPLQMHESRVVEAAEYLYRELISKGVEVLMDDRDERPGVKFNDADLIGIPLRVTVGTKSLKEGGVEIKLRTEERGSIAALHEAASCVTNKLAALNDSLK